MLQCVQSPGPSQPQNPFSDTGMAREVREERGASGAPLCHCICPEEGYHLQQSLRRMTLFNHEVMDDNTLASNDGCREGDNSL